MGWKSDFSSIMKDRGFRYYLNGKVKDVVTTEYIATGKIVGTKNYTTKVTRQSNGLRYSCTCPYAEGYKCKHEAALCYFLEKNAPDFLKLPASSQRESKDPIIPEAPSHVPMQKAVIDEPLFKSLSDLLPPDYDYGDKEDTVFDLKAVMEDVKVRETTYNGAKQLKLRRTSHSLTKFQDGMKLYAEGMASGYQYATVTLFRNAITKTTCSFYGCRTMGESLCEHGVALLLDTAEYLKKTRPGDITDAYARNVLAKFGEPQEILSETKDVAPMPPTTFHLRANLLHTDWHNSISLVVEKDNRPFSIKNCREFMDALTHEDVFTQGRNMRIDFASDTFTEESKPVMDFLMRLGRNSYSSQSLPVESNDLGILFKAIHEKGATIYLLDGRKIETATAHLPVTLTLSDVPGAEPEDLAGVTCKIDVPSALQTGNRFKYGFSENILTRYDDSDTRKFLATATNGYALNKEMVIGKKNLSQFFAAVLPNLPQSIRIKDNTRLAGAFIPDRPSFRFRMDYQEGIVSCTPAVAYSDGWHTLPSGYTKAYVPAEEKVIKMLGEVLGSPLQGETIFLDDDDTIYNLVKNGVEELKKHGEVECTDAFLRLMGLLRAPEIKIESDVSNGLLDLEFLSDEIDQEELIALLSAYKARRRFHRLKNGRFIDLDEVEELEKILSMIEDLGLTLKDALKGKMHIPLFRAFYLDQKAKEIQGGKEIAAAGFRSFVDNFETRKSEGQTEPPENLNATLRDYQRGGFQWLRLLRSYGFGGILADDMGLGKTLEMISVLLSYQNEGKKGTTLVVCPSSLVYNWKKEMRKFAPSLDCTVVAGNAKERQLILADYASHDVLVTSYDLLKRDIEHYDGKEFEVEVLDEAQYIKNSGTQVAKAAKAVNARTRFALTGTPIENRLTELWSIFDYLMPGYLYSQEKFKERFARKIENDHDAVAANDLRRLTAPFILRRIKEDVLTELPEKSEEVCYIQLEGQQKKLYEAEVLKIRSKLEKTTDESFRNAKISFFSELMKVRQLCQDPLLVYSDFKGDSTKRGICMELVKEATSSGHKVLVFSQFVSLLDLLAKDLQKEKLEYYTITGETDKKKRLQMAEDFNNDDVPVFLISLRAGGTGLNLTGADVVIHFDPWWNTAVMDQATDRTHRIGQTRPVTVYKLITENTIEEKILQMQEKKKDLADNFVRNEGDNLTTLSKDEILDLLR